MIDMRFGSITLHPLCSNHMDDLRAWRNDERIYNWCRQFTLINDMQQSLWFESQSKDSSIEMMLIKEKGRMIGVCGLTSIDHKNRRAEFSLYIAPDHQGKGMATDALKTLFKWGFNELNLNRIWVESFAANKANALFEKIGMQKEGARKEFYFKGGKYVDAILWSANRNDCAWLNTEPSDSHLHSLVYDEV